MAEMPIIDAEKCDGCALCVGVCHCNALAMVDKIITIVDTAECDWCTECEAICPTGAMNCPFEIIIQEA